MESIDDTNYQPPNVRDGTESEAPPSWGASPFRDDSVPLDDEIQDLRAARDELEAANQEDMMARAANLVDQEAKRAERAALRRQVAELLKNRRTASATPANRVRSTVTNVSTRVRTPADTDLLPDDSVSQAGTHTEVDGRGSRIKHRDPPPYKGNTLKEATIFVNALKTIFKIDPPTYASERRRVLYASTWLTGSPLDTWNELGDETDNYSWRDFESFVRNCVSDPVNRSLDVGREYEEARQKEGETVQAFALSLSVLERELHDSYTDVQRTRHLFNKLRPSLRDQIMLNSEMPTSRADLISKAERFENAGKPKGHRLYTDERRTRDGGGASKKRKSSHRDSNNSAPSKPSDNMSSKPSTGRKEVTCYSCGKKGHYSSDCRSRPQGGPAPTAVRKVGVVDSVDESMPPPLKKPSKKGRGQAATARFSLT